ncbi:SLC39A11 [Lepeophtheirus salmonis]|uniref:Zinc transporter ZIP11 n=1 Tax=Lepeophtheirus salmonis TaxID=72036 RepID=A0A7R8CTQ1_LEPSM|nr:SLC39A11 [Lepeophtheirus salmonis]CAF2890991.1 SLC39A11 [Lepeophtheirus salmonis]
MFIGYSPITQSFFGTLFTWGLTTAGAALAFFVKGHQRIYLDASLGFAGGVMIAASYWSLLEPAIEMTKLSGHTGAWSLIPVVLGFSFGALFVYVADVLVTKLQANSTVDLIVGDSHQRKSSLKEVSCPNILYSRENKLKYPSQETYAGSFTDQDVRNRRKEKYSDGENNFNVSSLSKKESYDRWKRILLLIIAITVHNIPEGLAVGVAFGAVGKSPSATFEKARNLAIGIGIQNLPEGF